MRTISRLLIAAVLSGCATTQLPRDHVQSPGALLFNGYANRRADCHGCHKGDATGTWKGPTLAVTAKYTDEEIIAEIDDGPSLMPSYRDSLSAEEKQQIVAWLRERFPRDDD